MAAPSEVYVTITDGEVAADQPLTTTLMLKVAHNFTHLEEWLGRDFVAAVNHQHDNIDSASVVLPNRSIVAGKMVLNTLTALEMSVDSIGSSAYSQNFIAFATRTPGAGANTTLTKANYMILPAVAGGGLIFYDVTLALGGGEATGAIFADGTDMVVRNTTGGALTFYEYKMI